MAAVEAFNPATIARNTDLLSTRIAVVANDRHVETAGSRVAGVIGTNVGIVTGTKRVGAKSVISANIVRAGVAVITFRIAAASRQGKCERFVVGRRVGAVANQTKEVEPGSSRNNFTFLDNQLVNSHRDHPQIQRCSRSRICRTVPVPLLQSVGIVAERDRPGSVESLSLIHI